MLRRDSPSLGVGERQNLSGARGAMDDGVSSPLTQFTLDPAELRSPFY